MMEEVTIKEASQDETQETAVTTQVPAKYIVIWHDNEEYEFLVKLDRHLQLLYRRLGLHLVPYYFGYRKSMPEPPRVYTGTDAYVKKQYEEAKTKYEGEIAAYQKDYRNAVYALKKAVLFIPCTSISFLEKFWKDMNRDPMLRDILF